MHGAFSPDRKQIVNTTCKYQAKGLRVAPEAPCTERGEYQLEIAMVALAESWAPSAYDR